MATKFGEVIRLARAEFSLAYLLQLPAAELSLWPRWQPHYDLGRFGSKEWDLRPDNAVYADGCRNDCQNGQF